MPHTLTPMRERQSRKPTGRPNPPLILLAGPEKSGKSYEAALGTRSDLVGMTYWIEIGGSEGTADYYGRIPGVRYEIVPHNGSYQDILDAIRWAVAQPPVDGKPNMITIDNVTTLWDMLSDEQALFARHRAERKARENKRRAPSLDTPITVDNDLWNRAKDRWGEILWVLRRHSGPTVLLARQEIVTAFENDRPTREKTRKIKAEKNLPAAVDAIVELHGLGEAHLTGVRTLHWDVQPGQSEPFPDFSIDALLRRLGFEEAAPARQVYETRPGAYLDEQDQQPSAPAPQQNNQRQGQEQRQGQDNRPSLSSKAAVKLIHEALTNPTDPDSCLRDIRETWGTRYLTTIPAFTKTWGDLDANTLITRCLDHIKEEAKKRGDDGEKTGSTPAPDATQDDGAREHREDPTPEPQAGQDREHAPEEGTPPSAENPTAPEGDAGQTDAGAQVEEPPGADEDDAPPPPDPQAEESAPAEEPEDTSAAEEPQDKPVTWPQAAKPAATKKDKPKEVALNALYAEADAQARLKFVTLGEHLGPITEAGDPSLIELKNYVEAQRPDAIDALVKAGQTALANSYRNARTPDLALNRQLAAYLDSAPASA
ncbi:hypothetical protein EV284_6350 [Streptomyces sp. BK022]|uniref:hypothetical protein n=1 Tax=Streptomyces sp. BK022 TaxID=2512123 RepID=UPI001029427F|nr:hypothetical protein [Streptomyces sp. BK022]RZU28184.1 hypothetical protein EV284_6350 [Streptomyces sp. BK022]